MVTRSGKDRDESSREEDGVQERVVKISRVSKVVKGGRRLSFSAVVVVTPPIVARVRTRVAIQLHSARLRFTIRVSA